MADPWSSSGGVDLLLGWTGDGGSRGLAAALRDAIRDGRLVPDTPLPSTRVLAAELGVARGTVTRAYGDLAAEGYLHTAQGAPTTVARLAPPPRSAVPPRPRPWLGDAARWDLMPGRPDLSSFPRAQWGAAVRSVLTQAESAAFGYGDVGGAWPLREALPAYLGRTRGVVADPDRVLICGGYSHAVAATAAVLRDRGVRRVAFEDPSLFVFRDVVAAHGLRIRRCRWTRTASGWRTSGRRRRWWSRRRTSSPPVWCWRRAAGPRWSGGPPGAAVWWSRTTTMASSASTASRWARCRRWRPSMWSTPARSARPSARPCGSAGWCRPGRWSTGTAR